MKTSTIKKRFESNKKNINGIARKVIMTLLGKDENWFVKDGIIRSCWTSGRGRYTSNMNYTQSICDALDILRIRYTIGNDAPRGGECGTFIKLITKIINDNN